MLLQRSNQLVNKFTKSLRSLLLSHNIKRYKMTDKGRGASYIIEPTTMNIQKFDPHTLSVKGVPPVITSYSTRGFTIQGNKVFGSIAILPQGFYAWKVDTWKDITIESLQLFTVVVPRIEIILIGTGDRIEFMPPIIRQYFRKHNIGMEVLDTRNACSTFNFLLEENRVVAAALIPPTYVSVT